MTLAEHYADLYSQQKRAPSVKPVVDALTEVMARLLLIQTTYAAFSSRKTKVIQFPYSEVEATVEKIEALIDLATANLDVPWNLVTTLRDELRGLRNLRLIKDLFSSQSKSSEAVENVFFIQPRSRKGYLVQWADTLRGIAQRFLNDGDRWLEIAVLNGLDYPYILSIADPAPGIVGGPAFDPGTFDPGTFDPGPPIPTTAQRSRAGIPAGKTVAIPGDLITLPLDAQDPKNQVVGSQPTDYGTLLGQDVLLLPSGYFEFDALGDFTLVSGAENLAQAVRHRLIIPKGQLPLHPDYGTELELYIGQEGTFAVVEQATLEARRTIRQDPRVTMIDNIRADFQQSVVTANMTVKVIGQESPAELNLVIPRAV